MDTLKKMTACLTILALSTPNLVWADDAKPAPKPPPVMVDPAMVSPLGQDQPAPYPGILFSPRAAASIVTDLELSKERMQIEVDAAVRKSEAFKDSKYNDLNAAYITEKTRLQTQAEENARRLHDLDEALKKSTSSEPSRTLWFGLGAVGGVAVTLVSVFVVVKTTK